MATPRGSARCSSKYVSHKGLYLSSTGRRLMFLPRRPFRSRLQGASGSVRGRGGSLYKNGQLCRTWSPNSKKAPERVDSASAQLSSLSPHLLLLNAPTMCHPEGRPRLALPHTTGGRPEGSNRGRHEARARQRRGLPACRRRSASAAAARCGYRGGSRVSAVRSFGPADTRARSSPVRSGLWMTRARGADRSRVTAPCGA